MTNPRASRCLLPALLGLTFPSSFANAAPTDTTPLKQAALAATEQRASEIGELASALWQHAEIALQETASCKLLADRLRAAGFTVQDRAAKLPTAFVASFGKGAPVIGIVAEFDALPGVGNQPVPKRLARTDGVTSGHGCGHNLFGAAAVGGALALASVMTEQHLPGTLKVFCTPAEETLHGKVVMARAGIFAGLDAVIDWHPGLGNEVLNKGTQAMDNLEIAFAGQAAHAAYDPWNGRSALDAVELTNHAVNMMREHIKPSARIHYVIKDGGGAPNVVPERALVWYFVRDEDRLQVAAHTRWLKDIARGAALATQTRETVTLVAGVHSYLFNRPLQEALQRNLELVGAPRFTDADQAFGRALQKSAGKSPTGFATAIVPLAAGPLPVEGGSTDSAEISLIAPTAAFAVATAPRDVPWHSWATTASHGTPTAHKSAVVAAKIIATTGAELLVDADLRRRATAAFKQATGGKPYRSPLD